MTRAAQLAPLATAGRARTFAAGNTTYKMYQANLNDHTYVQRRTVMITIRKSEERGHFDHGWLDTRHTFSFADYYHPKHMGFSESRVISEDWVKPGEGFGRHGHRDMEIISSVLEGELAHRDSTGGSRALRPGEVPRMSTGTGVMHSLHRSGAGGARIFRRPHHGPAAVAQDSEHRSPS